MARVDILILFLILEELFHLFTIESDVSCALGYMAFMLRYVSSIPAFRFYHKWLLTFVKSFLWGRSQDGRGIGQGDHFLPHKFIKRTFECWANSTKQLLMASRGHQALRKAAHHLRKEGRQNIKDKKRDKRVRDGDLSWEVLIEEVSKHHVIFSPVGLGEVFQSRRAT